MSGPEKIGQHTNSCAHSFEPENPPFRLKNPMISMPPSHQSGQNMPTDRKLRPDYEELKLLYSNTFRSTEEVLKQEEKNIQDLDEKSRERYIEYLKIKRDYYSEKR
jgi:hypothetical protein